MAYVYFSAFANFALTYFGASTLQYLDLSANNFFGSIPNLSLPENLTYLNLEDNDLTGITHIIFRLLACCFFIIPFPSPYFLPLLTANPYAGTLPKFDLPKRFQFLVLSSNSISGTLPDRWYLPLAFIDLANNSFSGTIPSSWTIPNLMGARFSYNYLTGARAGRRHIRRKNSMAVLCSSKILHECGQV